MKPRCAHCSKAVHQSAGAINRALRLGNPLYCNLVCAGLARRGPEKSKAQKVAEKRAYDMEYRRKNATMLKAKKRAYFERTYDPARAAIERKATMARHVEYCRRPEYKAWKREYDKQYRAKLDFGPFWESALLLLDIEGEVNSRMSRYDVYMANGTINKALNRRRGYGKTFSYGT